MIGVCTNARGCWPLPSECYELGLTSGAWVRSIVYSFDEFDRALQTLPESVKVCALLNSETASVGQDYSGWRTVVQNFATRFAGRVEAVECGNELDIWKVPVATAAKIVNDASPLLRNAGMQVVLGPVAGPDWQSYLETLAIRTQSKADWCGFHPYGQRASGYPTGWGFGEIDAAVRRAHELSGLPVAVSEFGIKVRDAGSEANQGTYVTRANLVLSALPPDVLAFAALFCLGDEMGSPGEHGLDGFGLRRLDGSHRPSWATFALVNGGPLPAPAPVPPVPTPAPSPTFNVGPGMLKRMAQYGDIPAADELYLKSPAGRDQWSECMAASGRLYRYVFSVDETFTYAPEDDAWVPI